MSVKIYTSVVVSVVLVALGLGLTPAFAATKDVPSTPTTFVTDEAQFVSPDAAADLERRLEAHHAATGQQVLLWIGRRDNRDAVEAWAARTFSAWGVGKRGRDDGVVLFILPAERKVRIEVGYGLEGALPDARAAQIIREAITPRLTKGDRDGAARAGVHAILVALGNPDDGQGSRGLSEPRPVVPDWISHPSWFEWLILGLGLLAMLILFVTHPRLALSLLFAMFSGRGGGGGGHRHRGGFSGGGGRSGGGGATGSW